MGVYAAKVYLTLMKHDEGLMALAGSSANIHICPCQYPLDHISLPLLRRLDR